ncbi:hypothetical protein JNW88_13260 [Micromonospora sp. ATA32]|nr:hypothetical protein [Micromonospora sp. ATA32]
MLINSPSRAVTYRWCPLRIAWPVSPTRTRARISGDPSVSVSAVRHSPRMSILV